MLTLVHSGTSQPLAWLPVMRGEMYWHPSGRTWANLRGQVLSAFTLEGEGPVTDSRN